MALSYYNSNRPKIGTLCQETVVYPAMQRNQTPVR